MDDDEPLPELPVLKDSEFYFTMDEEALCVFDSFASLFATHDFRFYREPTQQSVETIYSCHDEDQLELQRGENVFYLHPATTQQVSPRHDISQDLELEHGVSTVNQPLGSLSSLSFLFPSLHYPSSPLLPILLP